MTNTNIFSSLERSVQRHLVVGLGITVFFVLCMVALSTEIKLSGAVIASGKIVVDTGVKKIQHPYGGVVKTIYVKEGQTVSQGQPLMLLDDTKTRTNFSIITATIDNLSARMSRLEAELAERDTITFPKNLLDRRQDSTVSSALDKERSLFNFRRQSREGERRQLQERINQIENDITGVLLQKDAKQTELSIVATEISGVRELWKQQLVSLNRLNALERDQARLNGEVGGLTSTIARSRGQIAEIELQILASDQKLRSEVATEIRDTQASLTEYNERRTSAEDELNRVLVTSPQAGIIHQLAVKTEGGVIAPGEILMLVVPNGDQLSIEAHVASQDIDQLKRDQATMLRFTAFNLATTPEFTGVLHHVSPDLIVNEQSKETYYLASITLPKEKLSKLSNFTLVPGMPVEVFFPTEPRSILSYFLKPITDQLKRAFREE